MKNNRGQVLVAFALIMPLLLIIVAIFLDFGFIAIKKRQVINTVDEALEYALKHKEDEELEQKVTFLLKKNIEDVDDLEIKIEDNKIKIDIKVKLNSKFEKIFDNDLYEIEITKEKEFE